MAGGSHRRCVGITRDKDSPGTHPRRAISTGSRDVKAALTPIPKGGEDGAHFWRPWISRRVLGAPLAHPSRTIALR